MKSIGIWYDVKGNDLPPLEVHVNLWNRNIQNRKKATNPFIDLGISVPNFRKISSIDILLPFPIEKDEITDLYNFINNPATARLVFNEVDCEVSSKDRYAVIQSENFDKSKLLISIKNEGEFDSFIKHKCDAETTMLSIDLEELKNDNKFEAFNELYFRFRINSDSIKKSLFSPVQKKNWFLESGFVETQIVDIKINQERNLPHRICKEYRLKKYHFAIFKKIHLLVMSNIRDEVDTFGTGIYECRKLEEHDWDDYLEKKYDATNILAYHWKEKCKDENVITNFSKLVRISTASTNMKVIITYVVVVVLLGALGSGIMELIKLLCNLN